MSPVRAVLHLAERSGSLLTFRPVPLAIKSETTAIVVGEMMTSEAIFARVHDTPRTTLLAIVNQAQFAYGFGLKQRLRDMLPSTSITLIASLRSTAYMSRTELWGKIEPKPERSWSARVAYAPLANALIMYNAAEYVRPASRSISARSNCIYRLMA